MEFEEIYDDVQVTTGHHSTSSGVSNQPAPQYVYQDLVPKSSAAEYTNLSNVQSKRNNAAHDELCRMGYKSLMVVSGEDTTMSEYTVANQSGNFSLDESGASNVDSGSKFTHKTSKPLVAKRYTSQHKNVSINEPSANRGEDQESKDCQREPPKRNACRVGFLYCLVLVSIVVSLAALAVAIFSIAWSTMQYNSMANCLMELLRDESFCDECAMENATQLACMPFQFKP